MDTCFKIQSPSVPKEQKRGLRLVAHPDNLLVKRPVRPDVPCAHVTELKLHAHLPTDAEAAAKRKAMKAAKEGGGDSGAEGGSQAGDDSEDGALAQAAWQEPGLPPGP